MMVVASVSASAFATAMVPFARIGFSNTPIGPFHTTVFAVFTASAYSSAVFGADIQTHLVSRDLGGCYNRNLNLGVDRIRELCCDRGVYRKKQLLAKLLCLLDHLLAVVKLRIVYEGGTYFIALCLQEGVSHAAADDQSVALLKQVGDNIQLVCNLCAAKDCNKRSLPDC